MRFLTILAFSLTLNGACLAGTLSPPVGAVSPTMKTLDQVEPRIPIGIDTTPGDADSLFRIDQPGSYYLTETVIGVAGKSGIEIASHNVAIDLSGFALLGVPASLDGIVLDGQFFGILIHDGLVNDWDGDGIGGLNQGVSRIQVGLVERVVARRNAGAGIEVGDGSTVASCNVSDNGGDGIGVALGSLIVGCSSRANGGNGLAAQQQSLIQSCHAGFNTGAGIKTGLTCLITECESTGNGDDGIDGSGASAVRDCVATFNGANGITVSVDSFVVGNLCDNNTGAGIYASSTQNRIDGNCLSDNMRGIEADGGGNLVIRNSATRNTVDFDLAPNNLYGPVVDLTGVTTAPVMGSAAAGVLTTQDPWANISY